MRKFGLIGYPLGHSFSKAYFTERFEKEGITDCLYEHYPVADIGRMPDIVRCETALEGFNVTIPHKERIIPYLDELDTEAALIGAVNCVRITRGFPHPTKTGGGIHLRGYNTDAYGFEASLRELVGGCRPDALILGTGGAAKAVLYVLDRLGFSYELVSRREGTTVSTPKGLKTAIRYTDITPQTVAEHLLIINTTPLGMFPDTETRPPIPYEAVGSEHRLLDLVYNPETTLFMRQGLERGARAANGMLMLVKQAEKSREVFGL